MVREVDKNRLVRFMARVMEESGFKVYQNFQTSRHIIDIYGVLPTILGDVGVVVACKNYDERWEVGMDVLKEMEMVGKTLKASKVVVVTTSYFTESANNYAGRRNIKLIDKDALLILAKRFSKHQEELIEEEERVVDYGEDEEEAEYTSRRSPRKAPRVSLDFLSRGRKSLKKGSGKPNRSSDPLMPRLKPIFSNTIVLIIIVLLLSTLLTDLVSLSTTNTALVGISKILFSALLAYGLVLVLARDATVTLIKGTTVFFVSLLIYVIIIIFL
ncbi:MAG: restriction endonuclease [Methanobacteriales archaeon Met13]